MNKFQGLLHIEKGKYAKDKGVVKGPMSPMLAAKEFCLEFKARLDGFVRLRGEGDYSYDHLIIKSVWKNCTVYYLIVDFGVGLLPVALWDMNDSKAIITPIYIRETTDEKIKAHLSNLEAPAYYRGNPIIKVDEKSAIKVFKDAEKSGEFKIE